MMRRQILEREKSLMNKEGFYRQQIYTAFGILGLLCLAFTQCQTVNENRQASTNQLKTEKGTINKQKGVHFFSRRDTAQFDILTRNNIEWVTLVSWAYQEDCSSATIKHYYGDSTRMRQRDSSWLKRMKSLHAAGFKIFVKPHIWISSPSEGKWRSDIYPTSEKNWQQWKENYRDFILRYATLAQKGNAEMFCIGTELSRLSVGKATYWKALIQEVRGIYKGKITYAANWYNEYEKITFWDDLDYIGVQAYFPLVKNKNPTVAQLSKGWQQYLHDLKSMNKKYNRKIIFTEMGYKSTSDSGIHPWEWIENAKTPKNYSPETQSNCYKAFFKTVWEKDWFKGVHIWQMRGGSRRREQNNLDFTPLGKPAEQVIQEGFQ